MNTVIRLMPILFCCLLAGACSAPAVPRATVSRGKPIVDALGRPVVPGVDNFGEVTPLVWRGGKPTQLGMLSLRQRGVKTIIDLQEIDESAEVPPGVQYIHLPVSQWHADQVDVTQVLAAIRKNRGPVFIHCLQGRDRTGLAVAAYRLSSGWTPKAACDELEKYNINFWWRGPIVYRIQQLASAGAKNLKGL